MAVLGSACACCGESDIRFLNIDHIYGDGAAEHKAATGGKTKRNSGGGYMSWLHRRIVMEDIVDRYQILCYNCNCARYHNGGVCPHKDPK